MYIYLTIAFISQHSFLHH